MYILVIGLESIHTTNSTKRLESYVAAREMALLRALEEANQTLWMHGFKFMFLVRINSLSRDEAHLSIMMLCVLISMILVGETLPIKIAKII